MRLFIKPVKNNTGFTIAELMIATSIFAVVLIVALAGFLDIGHLFYKGVTTTDTDTVANQIFNDLTGNFQSATSVSSAQSANGYSYYCIGNNRYTYNQFPLTNSVSSSAAASHAAPKSDGTGGNFGLLKDTLPGSSACATPCDDITTTNPCPSGGVRFQNPVELLGDSMRLSSFSISPNVGVGSNFYTVSIIVAYGSNSALSYTTAGDPATVTCAGRLDVQQFCAVSRLDTGVYKGNP